MSSSLFALEGQPALQESPFPQWEGKTIEKIEMDQSRVASQAEGSTPDRGVLPEGTLPLAGGRIPEALRNAIGFKEGDRYQTRMIRQAILNIYRTGMVQYVEVQVRPLSDERLAVTFVLSEKRSVATISVSGQRRFTQKEIFDALRFAPGETFDESEWEDRLGALFLLYKNEGYWGVKIRSQFRTIPSDPFKTEIFLNIDEGDRARIKDFSFTGNRVFPDLLLSIPVLSRKPEHFSLKLLEGDMGRLQEFYKTNRYLIATVGPPKIQFLPESREVDIVLPISAGPKFDFFFHHGATSFLTPILNPITPLLNPLLTPIQSLAPLSPLPLPWIESLDRFVLISPERGATRDVLEESARGIEQFYYNKGYPFVSVSVEEKHLLKENRIEVHFNIEHLTRARIRKIEFKGNRSYSEKRLGKLIQLKKEGILTRTRFTKELLREDLDNLVFFYKKEGFQSVKVASDIRFDEEKKWAILAFNIEEGVQTRIGTIEIRGAEKLSSEGLFGILSLRTKDPYNKGVIRTGAGQLLTAYSQLGYIDAKVEPEVTFSSDNTVADVRYQVTEGRQVFFGSLRLFGNTTTHDDVLLREMAIQKGDPYDYAKILKSQQRLSKTALFAEIRFDPIRNPDDPTIQDMNLTVVERRRMAFEFGVGYLDTVGIRGFVEIGHRNLFGSGRKITSRAEASQLDRRYSLDYREPRLFSQNMDATIGATFFSTQRASFEEEAFVGTLGIEKQFSPLKFSPLWKGTALYQYEQKEISNVQPGVTLSKQDVGKIVIGSLIPSFVRDTRDDPLHPKNGSLHVISIKDAAKILGSEVQMVKITHQSSFFSSPIPRATFAFSARTGAAQEFGETQRVPLSERFFLGGRSTVRGYAQDSLGIEGKTTINGRPTGGNAMLILNEEVRLSLLQSLGFVFFLDHGNVWPQFEDIASNEIKSTVGAGLRYNTPFGPFRLDQGYKLNRESYESPYHVHFTLGHAF